VCVGVALRSHGRGHRFETCHAHHTKPQLKPPEFTARCPLGTRHGSAGPRWGRGSLWPRPPHRQMVTTLLQLHTYRGRGSRSGDSAEAVQPNQLQGTVRACHRRARLCRILSGCSPRVVRAPSKARSRDRLSSGCTGLVSAASRWTMPITRAHESGGKGVHRCAKNSGR
jgi:hypothetical protein